MGSGISEGLKIKIGGHATRPHREVFISPKRGWYSFVFFLGQFSREYVLFYTLTIRMRTCTDSRHNPKYMHAPSVNPVTNNIHEKKSPF